MSSSTRFGAAIGDDVFEHVLGGGRRGVGGGGDVAVDTRFDAVPFAGEDHERRAAAAALPTGAVGAFLLGDHGDVGLDHALDLIEEAAAAVLHVQRCARGDFSFH